jgi:hypothetical protein
MLKKIAGILILTLSPALAASTMISFSCKSAETEENAHFTLTFSPQRVENGENASFHDGEAMLSFRGSEHGTFGYLDGNRITESTRLKDYFKINFSGYWILNTTIHLTASSDFQSAFGYISHDGKISLVNCEKI